MPHPEMHSEETGLRNNQNFVTQGMRRIRQRMYVFRLGCHGRYKNCSVVSDGRTSLILSCYA